MQRINVTAWWVAIGLLSITGWQITPWFFDSWATDPYFSHGGLVMLWGLGMVVWRLSSAQQTIHLPRNGSNPRVISSSVLAKLERFLLPAGGVILFIGLSLDIASLKAIGWMLAIFGLLHWRLGEERFRSIAAPLYFTLLSIPWPWSIVQYMALPLQEMSSTLARITLDLTGLPVWQEGVTLDSGRFKLVVEEACSGMRSFVAVLTVAIYFMGMGWGSIAQRWLHPLVVLVIILCGNTIRLTTALAIGHFWNQELAMLWVEDISPFLLILFEALLLLIWLDKPQRPLGSYPRCTLANAHRALLHLWQQPEPDFISNHPGNARLLGVVFLFAGILSLAIPGERSDITLPEWPAPSGWRSIQSSSIDASLREIQQSMQDGAIVRVVRIQSLRKPEAIVDGQMIISLGGPGRDVDDPRYCYRSKGWRMLSERLHTPPMTGKNRGTPIVNEIIEELPRLNTTRLDWFAYRVGDFWVQSYMEFRLHQMLARALRQLDSIAVVHVSTPLATTGDRKTEIHLARQRLGALWKTMPLR